MPAAFKLEAFILGAALTKQLQGARRHFSDAKKYQNKYSKSIKKFQIL